MGKELMAIWGSILDVLSKETNEASFNTWIKPIYPISLKDKTLSLRMPNTFSRRIMENIYKQNIMYAIEKVMGEPYDVEFIDPITQDHNNIDVTTKEMPTEPNESPQKRSSLVAKYTFENFVVGPNNHLAYAAAQAVAKNPSEEYNPLFIYGGVGLGKTHLMQAIGHYIEDDDPEARVLYVTFEQFLNGLINSIQRNENESFRETYRNVDVLMVDDIHFISGKDSTQVEFFHTFNSLYNSDKQIIISSDRPPREIQTLEERLRSRFESGLIVDIQPPDLETRIAILRKKADMESLYVPDDVLNYIASHVKSNIRELEGALIRVKAYARLANQEITLELAKPALDNLLTEPEKIINAEVIKKFICKKYQLSMDEMLGKKRTKNIAFPRQIAMYLTREMTDLSLPKIGQEFGGRDHTTVLHAYDKISKIMTEDSAFETEIKDYIQEIKE